MNKKLFGVLIGVVLTVVALSTTGYTLARNQGGMMGMHGMMEDDEHNMMEHMEEQEMHEECEEMMETCPMMTNHGH